MEKLLNLLRDGHSRSLEMLAQELATTTDDILRKIDFLEKQGIIRRITTQSESRSCSSCDKCPSTHNKKTCPGCIPKEGFKHMGEIWEIIDN